MRDISKAIAIAAAVFCLVAILSVSSCHAGDAQRYEIGFNMPTLSTWQWVVAGVAVAGFFYWQAGGSFASLAALIQSLFAGSFSGAGLAQVRKSLDSVLATPSVESSLTDKGKLLGVDLVMRFEKGPVEVHYVDGIVKTEAAK